jgi:hypothetical protein
MTKEAVYREATPAQSIIAEIASTLLYEGYSLFPYHRSAIKNQKPIPFGVVYPSLYHVNNTLFAACMQAECIVLGPADLSIEPVINFLHLVKPNGSGWQTVERKIKIKACLVSALIDCPETIPFHFAGIETTNSTMLPVQGYASIKADKLENNNNAFRISVSIINTSVLANEKGLSRDEALLQSFLSTHIILTAEKGTFISAQNPPEDFREAAEHCENIGTWPILIDEENTTMLCSPIIVYDHPKIHPKSKGDLFDSTEIEEALILHFATMSDEEKNNIAAGDEKLRAMLDKVNRMTADEVIGLHGGMNYLD